MPLPANVNRKRNRNGTITLNHSVLFTKTAPTMAPGHRAEPADHHHREHAQALDRGEDLLAERLLVQHEQTARERREESREREREQLHACRAQAEGLRVRVVVARGRRCRARPASAAAPAPPATRGSGRRRHEVEARSRCRSRRRRTASTPGAAGRGR